MLDARVFPTDAKRNHSGHCVVGGVLELAKPLSKAYLDDPRIIFIFGSEGTFGYCGLSQAATNKLLYFSFYDSDLPPRGQKPDLELITRQVRERHRGWRDPTLIQCLEQATVDNLYPVFYLPDLPDWGRYSCVLVGDAAHAMTPATGQGGSQAFEDAQTLALLLAGSLKKYPHQQAIEKTIKGLFDIRARHVYRLKAQGLAMKEPKRPWSVVTKVCVYAFFFVMTKAKYLYSFFGKPVYPAHL